MYAEFEQYPKDDASWQMEANCAISAQINGFCGAIVTPVNDEHKLQETGQNICVREKNCELVHWPTETTDWQRAIKFGESLHAILVDETDEDGNWLVVIKADEQRLQETGQFVCI